MIAATVLAACTVVPVHGQPAPTARAPQTDQTVPVSRGARLDVHNHAGEVLVKAWERDAVRVQARHAVRTRVSVQAVATGVKVTSSGSHGPASVDYEINAPSWMPVKVNGHFTYIAVEGLQSEVTAETVRGDVIINGGATFVLAKSIEGDIKVSGARGRVTANSINQGVIVEDSAGDIVVETVNGPIRLTRISADSVDASTVNGNITYDGGVAPRGRYRFSSHNGNIVVGLPENASATFSVRTYSGTFNTTLALQRGGETGRGRRAVYTLGSGSAEFEIESFGGTIQVRREGSSPRSKEKEKKLEGGFEP
jgi:hypothetical protein